MTANDDMAIDLYALAIQERFLEEWRAGRHPRLSVYARRFPAYAAALAECVASLAAEAEMAAPESPTESFPERLWRGEGATRAMATIFASGAARQEDAHLPRVAEERSPYQVEQASAFDGREDVPDSSDHD